MRLTDCIALAGLQLTRRRMRSLLCALSVGVGVFAILLITSLGVLGQQQVRQSMERMGLSGLTVYVSQDKPGQPLTAQHAAALTDSLPSVTHAMPIKAKTGTYRTTQQNGSAVFLGIDEQLGDVMHLELLAGTLPTARQVAGGQRIAVIDETLAQSLYQRTNIVGKQLRFTIGGTEEYYKVVGVIRAQAGALGAGLGGLVPKMIYIPYACLAGNRDSVDQIFVQCIAGTDLNETSDDITRFLSRQQQVSGTLSVQNMSSATAQLESVAGMVTLLFLAVAAISFVVAMLGVLSGMLSATHEKTAEIGMFMALGARGRDIAHIFLTQSILLCLLGGLSGIAALALLLACASQLLALPLAVPPLFAGCVLGLSALCGALAGMLPAIRAARLRPVDAMRK